MISGVEIEIKLPVGDPEEAASRLGAIGAEPVEIRGFEENWVFDFPDRRLRRSGVMVRLRTTGGRSKLTLKQETSGRSEPSEEAYKVRKEWETEIGDGDTIRALAGMLGLEVAYRYQKYRRSFRRGGLLITLDELPIGNYIELEGPPAEIDETAARLGFRRDEYINVTYRTLHERARRARGINGEPVDLLFAGPGPT